MLGFDESAALFQPVNIHLSRNIVFNPEGDDQNQAEHKGNADEVMNIFSSLGKVAKCTRPHDRQQDDLPEGDVESGQAKKNKGHGRQPMGETFKGSEAGNFLSGAPCRNSNPSDDEIGEGKKRNHAKDDDGAKPVQENFVKSI